MFFYIGTKGNVPAQNSDSNDAPGQTRVIYNSDGTPKVQMRLYNATGGALTQYGCYVIQLASTAGQTPQVQAATAVASVSRLIAVATAATAAAAWDWFDVAGDVDVLTDGSGSAIAAGNNLKLAPGTNSIALIKDTGSGQSNETTSTMGVSTAANSSSNVKTRVRLYGLDRIVNT